MKKTIFILILFSLVLIVGCSDRPEKAKEKLLEMGISYSDAEKFFEAASNNNIEVVQLFLKSGLDPNVKDEDGNTVLIIAANNGFVEIAKLLLENNADFLIKNEDGEDALCWAAFNGNREILKLLVDKGQNPSEGLPVAFTANNATMVSTLLECGADPNTVIGTQYGNMTMLIGASLRGNLEMVRALLDNGARVEDYYNTTALIIACQGEGPNASEIAKLLINKGAEVNARDSDGNTPLMYASELGNLMLTKLLLESGAEVNLINNMNETALYFATYRGFKTNDRLEVMKLLLDYGADRNIRGGEYNVTPLELIDNVLGRSYDPAAYDVLANYIPKKTNIEKENNSAEEASSLEKEVWQLLVKANEVQNNMGLYESEDDIITDLQSYFTNRFIDKFISDGITYLEDDGIGNKGWVPNFCMSGDIRYYIPEYDIKSLRIDEDGKEIKVTQNFDGATEDGEYHLSITTVIIKTAEGMKIDSIDMKNY